VVVEETDQWPPVLAASRLLAHGDEPELLPGLDRIGELLRAMADDPGKMGCPALELIAESASDAALSSSRINAQMLYDGPVTRRAVQDVSQYYIVAVHGGENALVPGFSLESGPWEASEKLRMAVSQGDHLANVVIGRGGEYRISRCCHAHDQILAGRWQSSLYARSLRTW
jgi:hypothetical protein